MTLRAPGVVNPLLLAVLLAGENLSLPSSECDRMNRSEDVKEYARATGENAEAAGCLLLKFQWR
jgi:hypothetical protein